MAMDTCVDADDTHHAHSGSQDTAPSQQRPKVVANRQVFALAFRTHMTAAHSAAFIRTTFGALNRRHQPCLRCSFFSRAKMSQMMTIAWLEKLMTFAVEHQDDIEDREELR